MPWTIIKPAATSLLSEFPSVMTTQAITFRQAVEKYSLWTESSGASAGQPRPGACRAFFDVASNLSSAISATKPISGRLYITSDTSRLYGYISGTSVLLGSKNAITNWFANLGTSSDQRFLTQIGTSGITLASRNTIAFPLTYIGAAADIFIQLTPISNVTTMQWNPTLVSSGTSNFVVQGRFVWGSASTVTVMWRAHGLAVS